MAFSSSQILDVVAVQHGPELLVSWQTSAPAGTVFQVYLDRRMQYHGKATSCVLPLPPKGLRSIIVGAVGDEEEFVNFASSLPSAWNDRAELSWLGGTYLDEGISGFHVFMSPAAGEAVSYDAPVATVPAYSQGSITDGFGMGPFGEGGFGLSASIYKWVSGHLSSGIWQFAIKAFDKAGNEGPASTASLTITAPPAPPGRNPQGLRLTYGYDPSTRKATLFWLPPAL